MATKKNIIVGAANIWLGPSWDGVTGVNPAPAPVGTTSYRDTLNASATWIQGGYTSGGLEVSTDPSYGEVEVDQLLDSAKIFKEGMGLSLSTTFAEATLENLVIAWGQRDNTLTSSGTTKRLTISGGALGESPNERGLIAVGNGPEKAGSNDYSERTYHAVRVLSVEGSGHTLSRAEATLIPVTFRALPGDDGDYGYVVDRYDVA